MSIGGDLKKSLTGNIETAMLVIHDYRGRAGRNGSGQSPADAAKAAQQALTNGSAPNYPNSSDKILKVQFNPTNLKIDASSIPRVVRNSVSEKSNTVVVEDAKMMLTVILMFDDMDTYDSFMWEKFTSGLTLKSGANIANTIKNINGEGKAHSVQWQVESLVAALRNPYTRSVSFRWADFSFIGQLNAVNANYTMFSTSGRPVRAEVMLRIVHEMDPKMLTGWYDNFKKAFGDDASSLVKVEQNFGALLNLNL